MERSLLLRTPQQRLPMLYNGPDNPKTYPFPLGSRPPSNTEFVGPTRVYLLMDISIGSAVFAAHVTNKQTDTDHAILRL